jgi:uncharacterized LabA/DUF88 family protein
MRSHCALYVDVGYLLASAATRVTGTSLRGGIHVEYRPLIDGLIDQAQRLSGLPLLRVHWYDSARNGVPDTQQGRIGELAKVKLRLGRIGVDGQQKGVDLRIGLDLVAHARNGAAATLFLVSGDDDLTEAVEEAQVHGVQVSVLAVPNAHGRPHAVSRHLHRAADSLELVEETTIDGSVMKVELPPPPVEPEVTTEPEKPAPPSPLDLAGLRRPAPAAPTSVVVYSGTTGAPSHVVGGHDRHDRAYDAPRERENTLDADEQEVIDAVVRRVVGALVQSAAAGELAALERGRPSIPRDVDRALLLDLSSELGDYDFRDAVRFRLRDRFWEVLVDERA